MKSYVSTAVLALLLATSSASLAQEKSSPGGGQSSGSGSGAERSSGGSDGPGAGGGGGDAARGGSGGQAGAKDGPSGRSGQTNRSETGGRGEGGEPKRQSQSPAAKDGQATKGQSGGEAGRARQGEPKQSDKQPRAQDRRDGDRSGSAKSEAKDARPATKDRARSEQTETQKQQQRTQGRTEDTAPRRDRASEGAAAGEQGTGQSDSRQQAPAKGAVDRSGAGQQRAKERAQITTEQRDRVRTVIREERPRRAANVNIDIRVGRRLPRTVELLPLPSSVIEVVPDYRDYRYVYVRDEIVVVDPNTYEVVTVIDDRGTQRRAAGGSSGSKRQAALQLTQSERQILFRYAEYDQARADVQFRLGLGAEVPESVELVEFPQEVLTRVKKLEPFRYVVVEGRTILIVDPDDRQIELVVEPR